MYLYISIIYIYTNTHIHKHVGFSYIYIGTVYLSGNREHIILRCSIYLKYITEEINTYDDDANLIHKNVSTLISVKCVMTRWKYHHNTVKIVVIRRIILELQIWKIYLGSSDSAVQAFIWFIITGEFCDADAWRLWHRGRRCDRHLLTRKTQQECQEWFLTFGFCSVRHKWSVLLLHQHGRTSESLLFYFLYEKRRKLTGKCLEVRCWGSDG